MKYYALSRHDGGVEIMQVTEGDAATSIARWPAERQAEIARIRNLTDAEFAAIGSMDRAFRDAWRDAGGVIDHDMDKARLIHMSRIRKARDSRLAALDTAWMRATGQGQAAESRRDRSRKAEAADTFRTRSTSTPPPHRISSKPCGLTN